MGGGEGLTKKGKSHHHAAHFFPDPLEALSIHHFCCVCARVCAWLGLAPPKRPGDGRVFRRKVRNSQVTLILEEASIIGHTSLYMYSILYSIPGSNERIDGEEFEMRVLGERVSPFVPTSSFSTRPCSVGPFFRRNIFDFSRQL